MSSTSTTHEEAKEAVAGLFKSIWADDLGWTFQLGNEQFTIPASNPWARLVFRHQESRQYSLGQSGGRKFKRRATAFIQVFTQSGTGEETSAELVDAILTGMEGERIVDTTVCFLDVIPREAGADGKWYQVTVEANFEYTETK